MSQELNFIVVVDEPTKTTDYELSILHRETKYQFSSPVKIKDTAFIHHPHAPTYYFGIANRILATEYKKKWQTFFDIYLSLNKNKVKNNEKDYEKPIIQFTTLRGASEKGFKISQNKNWLPYNGEQLAIFATYDKFNRGVLNKFMDLLYLKSGTGDNLEIDVWAYLTSIKI